VKNKKIIFISCLVTLVLLFGGFWGYQELLVKRPVVSMIEKQTGMMLRNIDVYPSDIEIELEMNRPDQKVFTRKAPDLIRRIQEKNKHRSLHVKWKDRPNEKLLVAWDQMIFGIREGLETQKYTEIPETIGKWADKYDLGYGVKMNEDAVYILLYDGDHYLTRVMHVKSAQKGGDNVD
jgi:hypothetical protein